MLSIYDLKELAVTDTPLLLFQCVLQNGRTEYWSTHQVTYCGNTYAARVMKHNLFSIQTSSDQGVDAIPRVSVSMANADSYFSELEREVGWKGATLTVTFLFYNLLQGAATSDAAVLFQGIVNPPDQSTESLFQLSAVNWMNMQSVLLPPVRIQRRCPWLFPTNPQQRQQAVSGGSSGQYSLFYPCGYSPDQTGGVGAMVGGVPYTSCSYTRTDCEARGMFSGPMRFGGLEFVPSSIQVRSYGGGWQYAPVDDNLAIYNDFVPLLYGTAWYYPPIVFTRNDGNLTHMEVLLGMGPIQDVQKVLVNQIEIAVGQSGQNMTSTGWYNVISLGGRNGAFNPDFKDAAGNPAGDPYGSMAYMSVVVPNQISNGQSLPTVQVLADGLQLPIYGSDGTYQNTEFTANPVWILLDILQRSGWGTDNIDLTTFAAAAAYCDQQIQTQDLNGNAIMIPRFQCNLCLQSRRNAADTIRGIRNASRLLFTYSMSGLLQLQVENSIALQQPTQPAWSNSTEPLNGGWPAYEFSDGSTGTANILRKSNGEPSVQVSSRSIADTPNQVTIEFQDAFNAYQQDSLLTVDVNDVQLTGQVISTALMALGLPNYDQAARISQFTLDKAVGGNTYIAFQTSVKALGLRPGDIITVTYLKEGFERQAFRITKIAPGANYRITTITAQIEDDDWYLDTNGQIPGGTGSGLQPNSGIAVPRPLLGNIIDSSGNPEYQITESSSNESDGGTTEDLTVGFFVPPTTVPGGPGIPLVSLAATIAAVGGTLAGNQILYYAVSALDSAGNESTMSFMILASIPSGTDTNSVTLTGLSFDTKTVSYNVYRGPNPQQLRRIASSQALSTTFTDTGLPDQVWAPPDPNFDHANFYWRTELQPPYAATIATATTVGNSTAEMGNVTYNGMTVRILSGTGADQEYPIVSNTATTLTVAQAWGVQPDSTSQFVVAEAAWHFAATSKTSPVEFAIPNETGVTLHVQGRGANVNNLEGPPLLSTLTRWTIGGGGSGDTAPPPLPAFGLGTSVLQKGTVQLSGVAFPTLTNTYTVTAGTLTIYYWNELSGATPFTLSAAMAATDTTVNLTPAGTATAKSFVQIEEEVMQVTGIIGNGLEYQVTRGMHGTTAVSHAAQIPVYQLSSTVVVVPFPLDFFGSPLSGNWSYPISLPNSKVASAELFVTNSRGNSQTNAINLTQSVDYGLRTLSGGQYSFQVQGFLAVDSNPAPNVIVEAAHAVEDVYAIVKQAPVGGPIQISLSQNGSPYCTLTIPDGATVSPSVDGFGMPLTAQAQLSIAITGVGQTSPGSDLTVILRL